MKDTINRLIPFGNCYTPIISKILVVDQIPIQQITNSELHGHNSDPCYYRDSPSKSVNATIKELSETPHNNKKVQVPLVLVAGNPTIRANEYEAALIVHGSENQIIHDMDERATDSVNRQIDCELFKTLNESARPDHTIAVPNTLTTDSINLAFSLLEEHNLVGAWLIVHPQRYKDIRTWGSDWFDPATQSEILENGIYGYVLTAAVLVSTLVPKDTVYLLPAKEHVGVMPLPRGIRSWDLLKDKPPYPLTKDEQHMWDKSHESALKGSKLKENPIIISRVTYVQFGLGVINDYSVIKISVYQSTEHELSITQEAFCELTNKYIEVLDQLKHERYAHALCKQDIILLKEGGAIYRLPDGDLFHVTEEERLWLGKSLPKAAKDLLNSIDRHKPLPVFNDDVVYKHTST